MLPAIVGAYKGLSLAWRIGVIAGIVALIAGSYTAAYFSGKSEGKKEVRAEWDAAIAQQAAETNRQIVQVHEMETILAQVAAQRDQLRQQEAEQIKRKVDQHAKSKPARPLSPEFVRLYDDLRRVPNQAGDRVPTADPGAGASEVPRGEVRPSPSQLVQVAGEDGETIELTTDELYQAITGAYVKLGLAKDDYAEFSSWNDGREKIELERVNHE